MGLTTRLESHPHRARYKLSAERTTTLRRVRLEADNLQALDCVVRGSSANLGCRPIVWRTAGKFHIEVLVNDLHKLSELAHTSAVRVLFSEAAPNPVSRLALVSKTNRFAGGCLPRGLGRKE